MDPCSRLEEPGGVGWKEVNVGRLRTTTSGKRSIWWLQVAARSDRWARNLAFATRFCGAIGAIGAIGNIKRAAVRCGSFRLHWTLPAITVAAKVDTDSHAGNVDTHTGTRCVLVTVVIALNDHTARTAPITAAIIIADHSNRRGDLRWKVLTLLNEYVSSERVVSREHARARY